MASLIIDNMEYSTDNLAAAAYVTNGAETIYKQNTTVSTSYVLGNLGGSEYRETQGFQLSDSGFITAVAMKSGTSYGSPTGNWTLRIETDNAGVPSGTLANANATVTVAPVADNTEFKGTFATPFKLSGSTQYWLVIDCSNQTAGNFWRIGIDGGATGGQGGHKVDGTWGIESTWNLFYKVYGLSLQSYSESTIKTQGSYALKAVAAITSSLNKTLTHTFASPLDLTGVKNLRFDMRASRTGANVKLGLHDTGGTTTELTPTIATTDTFQTFSWDLSGVADANKDAIDTFIITITNADSANTFYLDFFGILQGIQGFWIG